MEQSYIEILEDVKSDTMSGAWVVARKAIHCIKRLIKEKTSSSVEELVKEIEKVAGEILKAQPGMAQLINFFNTVFVTIEQQTSGNPVVLSRKISGEAKRFEELSRNAVAQVAKFGADLIKEDGVILMHSNSSTILEIVKKARENGKTFHAILSESRPGVEGRACALELAKLGIESTFYVDAAISKGIDRTDVVLLGADSVSESAIVNKIGTKAICLLAREAVVKCYVACESSKFMPQTLAHKQELPRNPTEVWDEPPAETTIENY